MRAGISEPTRPDTARHSHCHLSVTTGPFSVSVLGPDEFSRLILRGRALSSPSPCRFIPAHPKSGRNRHGLHRPGISLAKRLDRVFQRKTSRRVPERAALRDPVQSPGPFRRLEDRLQHEQAPQRARLAHAGRVRRGLVSPTPTTTARIANGSAIGVRSISTIELRRRTADYLPSPADRAIAWIT